jgi:hypothetical protein
MATDRFTKACLAGIFILLAVIAVENGSKLNSVHAAVGKTYEYRVINLNSSGDRCGAFDMSQPNADGKSGWQIVGVTGGTYGGGGYSSSYNCYYAIEQR